ncbi:hypothetical protein ACPV5Q_01630 [Vibrio astriarenae]
MDKEKVFQCIHGFFQEEHVQKTIATIGKCQISGWEGWLQVEFAHYLETKVYGEKKQQFNWYREYKIITKSSIYDKSDEQNKYIIPDFWISSGPDSNAYYLIEFKRSNTGAIVREMKVDIEKWLTHIDYYNDTLECVSEPENNYKNLGVFFVGIDTKSTDEVDPIQGVLLKLYGESLQYRIGFLPVDTMVSA